MMIARTGKQSFSTILGLSLEDSRWRAVLLRRKNGSLQILKTALIPLDQDFLSANPDQLGRHLHDQLSQAGIKESRCVLSLPLSWVSTVGTLIPDLPDADVASFIEIEAERGFLFAQDSLSILSSRIRCPGGARFATLLAVPHKHLQWLDKTLKAAKLKPVSFTPGLSSLQPPDSEPATGVLALAPAGSSLDLQITCGGGVAVLRSLDVLSHEKQQPPRIDIGQLLREIRITLGQLPPEQRELVRTVKVFGQEEASQQMARELPARLETLGLSCTAVPCCSGTFLQDMLPDDQAVDPALMVAAHELRHLKPAFEFLPPKTSAWKELSAKIYSKKLAWAGTALAGTALLISALFLFQEWQLSRLNRQWSVMQPKVEELGFLQFQIKQFRPWFDNSYRSLRILQGLTRAFPDTGAVTAKSIEFRDPYEVTCSGEASDRQALVRVLDQLSAASEVQQLKVDQIRGNTTMQFTFNFQWESGGAGE